MATEIERKFLVRDDAWRVAASPGEPIRQGYLVANDAGAVRVRAAGRRGTLTIKGPTVSATRLEYEYEIPAEDAAEMLDRLVSGPIVEKTRYRVAVDEQVFEVDVFEGDNAGLIVAELELESEGDRVPEPEWLGQEVTDDPRYYNASLASHPYRDWSDKDD